MEQKVVTTVQDTASMVWTYVPSLVGALAILVIGWVVAGLLSKLARQGLEKTGLVGRVTKLVREFDDAEIRKIEGWIGQAVFAFLLLFVLIGFFQILGLNQITQPIIGFLNQIFEYLPRLIGPIVLVLVAWVVAKFLRAATKRAMSAAKIDEQIEESAELSGDKRVSVSETAGEAVYWLTFLVFLPAVLSSLELGGLLGPVRTVVDTMLGYLPNLLAASAILVIGWLAARIVRKIVTNLLNAAGADTVAEKAELQSTLGVRKPSELAGLITYVLIFIPVVVAALHALELDALTRPASRMLDEILAAMPDLFAGALLLVIAYAVARIVGQLTTGVLARVGFDSLPGRLGVPAEAFTASRAPSQIAGFLLTVGIVLFAVIEALRLIGFDAVADLIAAFLVFTGHIFLGLLIVALGLFLSKIVADAIADSKLPNSVFLATAARSAIIILAVAMGLGEMGLGEEIIALAFSLTLGAIAVALAIAFGIGGREAAAELVAKWTEQSKSKGKK